MEPNNLSIIHFDDDYIVNNIKTVYPLILKYFSEWKEGSGVIRALEISFGPCMDSFPLDELDEKLLKHACPVAKKFFIQILENTESYIESEIDISEHFYRCEEILSMLTRVIDSHVTTVSKIDIIKVKSLLMCSSEVLYEFYCYCSKRSDCSKHSVPTLDDLTQNLAPVIRKAQNLQQNIFQLLLKVDITIESSAVDVLNDILTRLYKSGVNMINLDPKIMVDLWKGYISILEKHYEEIKFEHDVSVPIESLSQNLIKKLETIIHISSNNLPIQNINVIIKILCFMLKVIVKISEKFTGFSKNCQNSLVNLLISLNWLRHILMKTHNSNIEQLKLLATGVDPLLNCLMNDKNFFHELSSFLENIEKDESQRYHLLLLLSLIVEKLILASQETRILWLTSDDNILTWIFFILSKCNIELCLDLKFPSKQIPGKPKEMTDCYGHLLIQISAFLMTSSGREFSLAEKVLIRSIMNANPWCSLLAADIWCILARFADSELCYEQLIKLVKILNNFGVGSQLPQKYFLESLVKRLFPLLSEKHKDLFLENHPRETNQYLWKILDIPTSEKLTPFNSAVKKFFNSGTGIFNEKDFEEMEAACIGFNFEMTNCDSEFEKKLSNLWKFDSIKLMSNPLSNHYLKFLCSVTVSSVPFISSTCVHQILCEMKSSLENFSPVIRSHCLEIVLQCTMAEELLKVESICKLISLLFYNFLKNQNVFVRLMSIDIFSKFACSTCRTELITQSINNDGSLKIRIVNYLQMKHPETCREMNPEKCLQKLKSARYEHFCIEGRIKTDSYQSDCGEPPRKKIVLEKAEENSGLENLLVTFKRDAERIQQRARDLNLAQRMEISSISDMLREIVGVIPS